MATCRPCVNRIGLKARSDGSSGSNFLWPLLSPHCERGLNSGEWTTPAPFCNEQEGRPGGLSIPLRMELETSGILQKPNLPYGGLYFVPSPFGEGLYNPGARAFAGK